MKPRQERFFWVEINDPTRIRVRLDQEREKLTPAHHKLFDDVSALIGRFIATEGK